MYAASHKIRSENVEAFKKKVASFNRRAAKGKIDAGLELIINHEVFEEVFVRDPDTGRKILIHNPSNGKYSPKTRIIPRTWVSIIGETPKLNGWELCARYDFERDAGGNPVCYSHAVPGIETPEEYWEIDKPYCDHCGENRYRKNSFLVRSEAGEYKVVGRNCLKDFLGHTSPEYMINWFTAIHRIESFIDDIYAELGPKVKRIKYFNLEDVLAWTASVTSKVGWMSGAKAYENGATSTAWIVFDFIDPPNRPEWTAAAMAKWLKDYEKHIPNEKHIEVAKRIMELVGEAKDDGEYIYKLKKILDAGVVSEKNRNVWVSAITLYIKDENIKKRPVRDVPDVVEGRYEIEGKIESFKEVENAYSPLGGTIIKMIMEDAEGRRYWGTCPSCLVEREDSQAEIGSKIKVTVTVEASDRDSKFGFMKRPTKPVLIA